jgi:predicted RNA polymerase sigma factor
MTTPQRELAEVVRIEGGRILGVLAAATGDLQLAEDAVQDASVAALEVWPRTGVPVNPAGWLYVAARRKALDVVRREASRSHREETSTALVRQLDRDPPPDSRVGDDVLRLISPAATPPSSSTPRWPWPSGPSAGCRLRMSPGPCWSRNRRWPSASRAPSRRSPRRDPLPDPADDELEAAIAARHSVAPSHEATDWVEIVRLYRILAEVHPRPVVDLNAAIAVAEVDGPAAGLDRLDRVDPSARSHLWHVGRGAMLVRLGCFDRAVDAFELAVEAAPTEAERRYVAGRLRALRTG